MTSRRIPCIATLLLGLLLVMPPVSVAGGTGMGGRWTAASESGHYRATIEGDGVLVEWVVAQPQTEGVRASKKLSVAKDPWELTNPEFRSLGERTELYLTGRNRDSGETTVFKVELGAPGEASSLGRAGDR